jgi:uncharacterized protein YjiS (DUF1127 family)
MRQSTEPKYAVRAVAAAGVGRIGRQYAALAAGVRASESANEAVFAEQAPVRSPGPDAFRLHAMARADRARRAVDLAAAVWHFLAVRLRQRLANYRQGRQAHATYRALSRLDARTLRDIGLDRSEIRSVAAETGGLTAVTRVQLLQPHAGR